MIWILITGYWLCFFLSVSVMLTFSIKNGLWMPFLSRLSIC